MRIIYTLILSFVSALSYGQLTPGFNIEEAKYTIAMCNSFNFLEQFGSNKVIVPEEFKLVYTSDILSMDNKFQVYENGKVGVINYRGSTNKLISWVENCYSAMIPGKGTIKLNEIAHKYAFSEDTNAAVHAGYALTIVILSEKIKQQISALNNKGIYDIIITGHSQGGALATMTRAYLENLPKGEIATKNIFKTYSYAQPMCGNLEFSEEYNKKFSSENTSFFIVNTKDPVPYLPFNYEEGKLVTKKKVAGWLLGESEFSIRKLGKDAFIRSFESLITKYVKGSNSLINKLVSLKLGKVEVPKYVADINYYPTGKRKEIEVFKYPKVEVDTTNFEEKDLADLEQREDGNWYKKETKFFQHKPYNYYVYVLKKWDKDSYKKLDDAYLLTDL